MLSINTVSGKSRGGDHDLPSSAKLDPQVIQEYREVYLQIASKVQSLLSMVVMYTYDKLYKLGCDHVSLSDRIDVMVSYELRLSGYSLNDQVNILFHGPYIQSQILHHHLSEFGARNYVRQRLAIAPSPALEASQAESASSTAA